MCAAVKYLPGDVVWVKVPRYPWWPAEVVAQQDCKIPNNGKKDPVAYITFPCEDAYDIIRSESNIMPFDSENKKNFIKKGENLPKDLKERFLLAMRTSQKTLKKNQAAAGSKSSSSNCDDAFSKLASNTESPFSTRHFPSREPSFLQESSSSLSANTTTADTSSASILGSKTITGSYRNEMKDHLRYSCGQCNFTTSRLNLMLIHYKPEENVLRCPNLPESIVLNAESRKRRIAENDAYLRNQQYKTSRKASSAEPAGRVPCYARIPASPPSHKSVPLAQRDRGSCYMFHDEPVKQPTHKPSFSYRSLQKNKVGSRKVDTQSPKRALKTSASSSSSSSSPSPSSSSSASKTYTKLKSPSKAEQRNGILSPNKSDKKKEQQEEEQQEQQQQQQQGEEEEMEEEVEEQQEQQQQQQAKKLQLSADSVSPTHESEETVKKASPEAENLEPEGNDEGSEENLKDAKHVSETKKSDTSQEKQVNSDLKTDNKVSYSDEDSSCSTDDEVTEGLSAMKSDLPVVENDTVWVKFSKYPFWPALISKVYTKKHHIYRLSVRFFGEILAKETLDFGMSYTKDTVISFNDPRKEEFIKQGQESEWKEKFEDALQKVNDYINKKDDGELTPISDEQYLCKSNSSSPDPSESVKNEAENTSNETSWYPIENVNIVEESHTVHMVSSDLVEPTEDVCQTVLELENSESSKDFSAPTVSVMPEIWIPSVDETIGSEVVLHDIDQDVLVPRDSA